MAKKVVIEGDAQIRTEANTITLTRYKETFILDDSVQDVNQARSVIKNGLLHDRLTEKVKNYKRFRTYEIKSFEDTEELAEKSKLDKLLVEATKLDCMPENLNIYSSADGKEKALERAIESKKKRQKSAKKKKNDVEDQGYVD